ncbi:2-C-methyl-D-erythritol 4-phosphate cytidylyltransferase [Noviherbaspirillum massiliense]|uniref:2-C-methyl-D-erythritol 4-phosphate cytidylyltransferase n=1 Tax=Noviherbaspirillum massiliense TaxID=1465823 RepID=UPI00031670D8|nr:2-C-methyl-D-erythritol 4-phosphate cytidylyltransferase [Noviherbaspirillum massiliense]
MTTSRFYALVPAAGVGARMGTNIPKQYMPLAGKPILLHALETFAALPAIAHTYVVVNADDAYIRDVLASEKHLSDRLTVIYDGGSTRQQSVLNGLHHLRERLADDDWVLVHDAARPGLSVDLVARLLEELREDAVGGLLAMPVVDTLKRADGEGRVEATVPRAGMWAAQTPQMFRYALLCRALEQAQEVTDEASAVEALGLRPKLVGGSPRNFKITLPHDIALAELYLKGIE